MADFRVLALASAAALSLTTAASAADLMIPQPMPPTIVEAPMPVEDFSGWYIRGDVGGGYHSVASQNYAFPIVPDHDFVFARPGLSWGYMVGVGFGYQFNSWLRADITVDYRGGISYTGSDTATPKVGKVGLTNGSNTYAGSLSSIVALANVYADLGTWSGITPYIGAGIGVAHNTWGFSTDTGGGGFAGGSGTMAANSTSNLAWALMAGASYDISPRLKLDLSYRYLNMGNFVSGKLICVPPGGACGGQHTLYKAQSHDVRLGLRYMFGAPAAPMAMPAPMPVVARY